MIFDSRSVAYILGAMEVSELPFALTGSRAFGYYHPMSDYDFFTTNIPDVQDESGRFNGTKAVMQRLGFTLVPKRETLYCDMALVDLYQTEIQEVTVQVQVVTDFEWKLRAQHFLMMLPQVVKDAFILASKENKKAASEWWNWAYSQTKKK